MPHFIVDCTEKILELKDPKELIEEIFETAFSTGLFKRDAIKNLNLVSKKYEIETEIVIKSKRDKLKILEVPVFRYERKHGVSKLFDIPFGRLIFMLKVLKVIFYGYIFWK